MNEPPLPLPPDALCRRCDPVVLGFATTAELDGEDATLGQQRALAALDLSVAIASPGHNVYVAGPPGSGRQ